MNESFIRANLVLTIEIVGLFFPKLDLKDIE